MKTSLGPVSKELRSTLKSIKKHKRKELSEVQTTGQIQVNCEFIVQEKGV